MDINLWLVKEGWAFLTFYASMTTDEIIIYCSQHQWMLELGAQEYRSTMMIKLGHSILDLSFKPRCRDIHLER